jgi:hypothetical protein
MSNLMTHKVYIGLSKGKEIEAKLYLRWSVTYSDTSLSIHMKLGSQAISNIRTFQILTPFWTSYESVSCHNNVIDLIISN